MSPYGRIATADKRQGQAQAMIDRKMETDVLVIGGGGGGLRAAIEADAAGARVIVVSKGIVGKSGLTQTAVTGFQVALGNADPRDNPDVHFDDSMRGSYGVADPELVRIFTREAHTAVEDIEAFGARFDRDENGQLIQRALDSSQTYPRSLRKGDSLGTPIMQALRKQAKKRNISCLHEILVTKLLVDCGRVCGAVALDFRTGELLHIAAKAVIMATGGGAEIFPVHSNTPDATGDGCILALEAGADLVDMEFVLMLGHAVLYPEPVRGVLFTYQYLLPKGARSPYNADGEPFLAKYDPEGSDNPARHIYARAIFGEVRAGRGSPHGGVFFDPASVSPQTLHETLPSQTNLLETLGVDKTKPIEVGVAAHYFCGGIKIGPQGNASLAGLYAVGECSGGPHGAARVGGNSLTEVLVFGKRAGKHAAESVAAAPAIRPDGEAIEAESARLAECLAAAGDGPQPADIIDDLKKAMGDNVGVVRNADGLHQAASDLRALETDQLQRMALTNHDRVANYQWVQAIEARTMVRLGRVVAAAALERTESRGAHFREDFEQQNDAEWQRNIIVQERDGDFTLRRSAIVSGEILKKAG
jgi:succinate dehydrogenase/fumarate reductase flavoprotein subunit